MVELSTSVLKPLIKLTGYSDIANPLDKKLVLSLEISYVAKPYYCYGLSSLRITSEICLGGM